MSLQSCGLSRHWQLESDGKQRRWAKWVWVWGLAAGSADFQTRVDGIIGQSLTLPPLMGRIEPEWTLLILVIGPLAVPGTRCCVRAV